MKADTPLVVLSTDFGPIAISADEFDVARRRADAMFAGKSNTVTANSANTPLLDAEAIAKLFHLSATWFLARARENQIPHVRIGKYVRFDPYEVRTFLNEKPERHANS